MFGSILFNKTNCFYMQIIEKERTISKESILEKI